MRLGENRIEKEAEAQSPVERQEGRTGTRLHGRHSRFWKEIGLCIGCFGVRKRRAGCAVTPAVGVRHGHSGRRVEGALRLRQAPVPADLPWRGPKSMKDTLPGPSSERSTRRPAALGPPWMAKARRS